MTVEPMTRRWDGGSGRVRVLYAVLRGATTHDDLMVATGYNKSTCHAHLVQLRRMGLVDWEPASQGTIRPTCRIVPL